MRLPTAPIIGLPDDEEDSFSFLDGAPAETVAKPVNPRRVQRIARKGFCDRCATACATGERDGFEHVEPVCSGCRGLLVPVVPNGSPRVSYRAQRWAAGKTPSDRF